MDIIGFSEIGLDLGCKHPTAPLSEILKPAGCSSSCALTGTAIKFRACHDSVPLMRRDIRRGCAWPCVPAVAIMVRCDLSEAEIESGSGRTAAVARESLLFSFSTSQTDSSAPVSRVEWLLRRQRAPFWRACEFG